MVALVGAGRISVARRGRIDTRIWAVMRRQNWRASREQLLVAGVSASAIDRRLRNGRLDLVYPGVYGLPGTADVSLAAETAALLACGHDAMLSHHSAATLWELRPGTARPIHVTIPADRGFPAPEGVKLHRSRILRNPDLHLHRGLPITSPARTYLDIAATLADRDLERLLDEGLFVRRIVTRSQIEDVVVRAGGHPGRARLARVADRHTRATRTDSPPEERLLALIRGAGLPEPHTQVHMLGYVLDFVWPELRLAVEVDAYGTHGSPSRFEADRRRDARLLTEAGISVIRVTRAAIETRALEALGLVARAVGQREADSR